MAVFNKWLVKFLKFNNWLITSWCKPVPALHLTLRETFILAGRPICVGLY